MLIMLLKLTQGKLAEEKVMRLIGLASGTLGFCGAWETNIGDKDICSGSHELYDHMSDGEDTAIAHAAAHDIRRICLRM